MVGGGRRLRASLVAAFESDAGRRLRAPLVDEGRVASACGPTSGGDGLGGGVGRRLAAPLVDVEAEDVTGRAG